MNVAARHAALRDVEAMAAILGEVGSELAPLRGGAVLLAQQGRPEPVDSDLRAFVATTADGSTATSPQAAFVGTIDGEVVGFATVATERLLDGSRLGVIRELAVLAGARGVGVGEAILDEVVGFCRRAGCRGIDSYALPGTRETKNFFETFGFTARLLVVHTSLLDEPGLDTPDTPGTSDPLPAPEATDTA